MGGEQTGKHPAKEHPLRGEKKTEGNALPRERVLEGVREEALSGSAIGLERPFRILGVEKSRRRGGGGKEG